MVFGRRPHQRRLAEPVLPRVDVGAAAQSAPAPPSTLPVRDAVISTGLAFGGRGVRIGAGLEQRVDDRGVCRWSPPASAASRRSGWPRSPCAPARSSSVTSSRRRRGPPSAAPSCRPARAGSPRPLRAATPAPPAWSPLLDRLDQRRLGVRGFERPAAPARMPAAVAGRSRSPAHSVERPRADAEAVDLGAEPLRHRQHHVGQLRPLRRGEVAVALERARRPRRPSGTARRAANARCCRSCRCPRGSAE